MMFQIIYSLMLFALFGSAFQPILFSPTQTHHQMESRDLRISPRGQSYIDPEILPGGNLMAYQSGGEIHLVELDPATGLISSSHNTSHLIDTQAVPAVQTFNGPEFGIDAGGWALYYAKFDQEISQIWRATLDAEGLPQTQVLSAGAPHQTQLVSRNPRAVSTRVAAIQGDWQNGTAVWFDEESPADIHTIAPIERGISSMRWVNNSYLLTYSQRTGAERGQIVLLDTDTKLTQTLTADEGDKTDPYGWYAPEYEGELLVLAIVDNAAVAIYRNTGAPYWERIATLYPPAESQFDFVSSAEPFTLNGRSYMSLVIKDARDNRQRFSDSEVWLFDLNPDPNTRYAERCDSGENGFARSDPEIFMGAQQVFVYYNVLNGPGATPYEARRCQSALSLRPESTTPPIPATSLAVNQIPCQLVMPQDTDPGIDTELKPHHVCYDPTRPSRGQLLVFFPGTGAYPEDYQLFVQEAAGLGLHALGLSYINPLSINLEICARDPDPDCVENVRREVLYAEDLRPDVSVSGPNAALNRLVKLLQYLDQQQPEAGWGQYLEGDMPRWDRIMVAGHSQGGGMAAYLAHEYLVLRAVLFSWVDLRRGQAAPWIKTSHATPPERIYYFDHFEDRSRGEAAKLEMFRAFGIDALGQANVDTQGPPYENAHILGTALTPAEVNREAAGSHLVNANIAGPHNVVAVDDYIPLQDGLPLLRGVWHYLLTVD